MGVKPRAIADADKVQRRNALLDAAEALFIEQPDRMASVSEVAEAAGLAKGTVYLYFPSKEEMLLALHERHVAAFFADLDALLDCPGPLAFEDVFAITRRHMISSEVYLPLTSRCFGLMDRELPLQRALEFRVHVGRLLSQAGDKLERHFTALQPGEGVAVLCNSYGLMMGLWQLLHPNKRLGADLERPELRIFEREYEAEVERALRALWSGTISGGAAPAVARGRARAPMRRARGAGRAVRAGATRIRGAK